MKLKELLVYIDENASIRIVDYDYNVVYEGVAFLAYLPDELDVKYYNYPVLKILNSPYTNKIIIELNK